MNRGVHSSDGGRRRPVRKSASRTGSRKQRQLRQRRGSARSCSTRISRAASARSSARSRSWSCPVTAAMSAKLHQMRCGRRRPGGEGSVGALRRRGPRYLSTVAEATKAVKLADKTPRSRVAVTRGVCRPVYLRVPHSLSTWDVRRNSVASPRRRRRECWRRRAGQSLAPEDPVRAQGASRGRCLSRTAPPVRKAVSATARGCRSPLSRHPRGPSRCSRNQWRLPARGARRSTYKAPELGRI